MLYNSDGWVAVYTGEGGEFKSFPVVYWQELESEQVIGLIAQLDSVCIDTPPEVLYLENKRGEEIRFEFKGYNKRKEL